MKNWLVSLFCVELVNATSYLTAEVFLEPRLAFSWSITKFDLKYHRLFKNIDIVAYAVVSYRFHGNKSAQI